MRKCIIAEENVPSPGAVPGIFLGDEDRGTCVQDGATGSEEASEGARRTQKENVREQESPAILMSEVMLERAGKQEAVSVAWK